MTTLIGYRWKSSDVWSRVVLITRKLPKNFSSETECVLYDRIMFSFTWSIKIYGLEETYKELLVVIA